MSLEQNSLACPISTRMGDHQRRPDTVNLSQFVGVESAGTGYYAFYNGSNYEIIKCLYFIDPNVVLWGHIRSARIMHKAYRANVWFGLWTDVKRKNGLLYTPTVHKYIHQDCLLVLDITSVWGASSVTDLNKICCSFNINRAKFCVHRTRWVFVQDAVRYLYFAFTLKVVPSTLHSIVVDNNERQRTDGSIQPIWHLLCLKYRKSIAGCLDPHQLQVMHQRQFVLHN